MYIYICMMFKDIVNSRFVKKFYTFLIRSVDFDTYIKGTHALENHLLPYNYLHNDTLIIYYVSTYALFNKTFCIFMY